MKKFEIKEMNNDELVKRIKEEEINLIDLNFALATKQLVNTSKIRQTKKDIARMKTLLRERELRSKQENKNVKS